MISRKKRLLNSNFEPAIQLYKLLITYFIIRSRVAFYIYNTLSLIKSNSIDVITRKKFKRALIDAYIEI